MKTLPTSARATGPQTMRVRTPGATRPVPQVGLPPRGKPQDYEAQPDPTGIPLPTGFIASGPIVVTREETYRVNAKGITPNYKETE